MNKVVEDLSLLTATHHFSVQLLSLSAANYILYVSVVAYSSLHHISKSSVYNAAMTPFGSSETKSLMNSRNNVGDRAPPCRTSCLSSRDSCAAVVEVGFYTVEYIAGNAIPQQFD